jgi:hypothetical protein
MGGVSALSKESFRFRAGPTTRNSGPPSGMAVALRFYGAVDVHTSRTMSACIKAFAPVTLPVKICVRRARGRLCYHVALFLVAGKGFHKE